MNGKHNIILPCAKALVMRFYDKKKQGLSLMQALIERCLKAWLGAPEMGVNTCTEPCMD